MYVEVVRPLPLHCRCDVILAVPVSTRRPEGNVGGRPWLRSLSATTTDLGELLVLHKSRFNSLPWLLCLGLNYGILLSGKNIKFLLLQNKALKRCLRLILMK